MFEVRGARFRPDLRSMERKDCEAAPSLAARSRGREERGTGPAVEALGRSPGTGPCGEAGGSVPQHMLLTFASGVMQLGNSITGRRRGWGAPGLCSREDGARVRPVGFSVCLSTQRWRRTSADLSGDNLILQPNRVGEAGTIYQSELPARSREIGRAHV